ncbi:MAG: phosphoglucosamine mutase [Acidimicrobiales bacterium]
MTLRFGTDGVRGPASEFSDAFLSALGQAAAEVLGAAVSGSDVFVIGRDTRESGALLESSLSAGLQRGGAKPLSIGVVPTPAVAWVCAQRSVPGAVISASHNPWTDNGIKFFAAGGRKLSYELEAKLEARIDELVGREREDAKGSIGVIVDDTEAVSAWCDSIIASSNIVFEGNQSPLRIVIDCANGSASLVAPTIFRSLGLEVEVLHAEPNGRNINDACGSTHPEDLQRAVLASGAALGLAFDGDADRLLAVDELGGLIDGDQLIALFARNLHEQGNLAGDRVVVTVMSNLGFRLAMESQGIEVIETPVGDRHVLEALARTQSSLGGEQSGHIVFADLATTGDGILSGVQLVGLVASASEPFSVLAASSMNRLPQVLLNVTVETPREDMESFLAGVIGDEIAAVELSLGSQGRVLIRPSGTEPLVRIMVEAPTAEQAESAARTLVAAVLRVCSA